MELSIETEETPMKTTNSVSLTAIESATGVVLLTATEPEIKPAQPMPN